MYIFDTAMLMINVHDCVQCTLYPPYMLAELLYTLQRGDTPLHCAADKGHITCVEHLLSTPGINVNIKNEVSWSI